MGEFDGCHRRLQLQLQHQRLIQQELQSIESEQANHQTIVDFHPKQAPAVPCIDDIFSIETLKIVKNSFGAVAWEIRTISEAVTNALKYAESGMVERFSHQFPPVPQP